MLPNEIIREEEFLSFFLTAFIGKRVGIFLSDNSGVFDQSLSWLCFVAESNFEFSIAGNEIFGIKKSNDYFRVLVSGISKIKCNHKNIETFKIQESFNYLQPLFQKKYQVIALDNSQVFGEVYFAGNVPSENYERVKNEKSGTSKLLSKTLIRIPLALNLPELKNTFPLMLKKDSYSFSIGEILNASFNGYLGKKMNLLLENKVMSDEKNVFPISLDIGVIKLSFEDLAALRPGECIECAIPESIPTTLRIGESAWAKALLSFSEDNLLIKVEKILALGEETNQENARILQ